MVEKIIDLYDIELVDFLGVENKNIQEIELAFPKTKIVSRGNKISIKGNRNQLLEVEKIINIIFDLRLLLKNITTGTKKSVIESLSLIHI